MCNSPPIKKISRSKTATAWSCLLTLCCRPPTLEDQTSSQQPCPSTDMSHSHRSGSSDLHQRLPHQQPQLSSVPHTVTPELPTRRLHQQQPVYIPQRSQSQPTNLTQVKIHNDCSNFVERCCQNTLIGCSLQMSRWILFLPHNANNKCFNHNITKFKYYYSDSLMEALGET